MFDMYILYVYHVHKSSQRGEKVNKNCYFPDEQFARIEKYAEKNTKHNTSEAIRVLIDKGFEAEDSEKESKVENNIEC